MLSDVYINQEQFDEILTIIQQIADKQADIHTVLAHTLLSVIMFMVLWGWSMFAIKTLIEPVGDQ